MQMIKEIPYVHSNDDILQILLLVAATTFCNLRSINEQIGL